MFKRPQFNELKSRIAEPRNKIQTISGPRQVGKSTMVKQVLQETNIPHLSVSADNVDKTDTFWISEMWATARAKMKAAKASEYLLVIDEVHKLSYRVGDFVDIHAACAGVEYLFVKASLAIHFRRGARLLHMSGLEHVNFV